ncbi:haloacid dehalogenase type II [Methylobacterium sp. J-090]|uniref:haloacid dehalogenase type II n=1 Tax=Methylobacterium sp. J-090 TaxID=2836666 RepID=UPI001FB9413A|nr:haloacid dehalogenase type II [Methylobacterium sp. J-090]MCJ2080953.1 haloacid dehalogenase type II [Methylobacterium sp. J-090]
MTEYRETANLSLGRRNLLKGVVVTAAASAWTTASVSRTAAQPLERATNFDPSAIKVLLFDVQGTTVDFYATIVRRGESITSAHGIQADWTAIVDQWRSEYRRRLDQVIAGTSPWRSTDRIFRESLDALLESHDWGQKLDSDERDKLTAVWSQLEPWPDSVPGLERLSKKYTLSTLSNGSMASVVSIAKLGRLPFDCILTAELVQSSKPDPKVYALAQNAFAVRPDQILMVACHKYDLKAAKALGFRVAFVPRPLEFGPRGKVDLAPESYFDLMPKDFIDLADQMGA